LWKIRKVLPTKVEENICDDDDHHQAVSFCPSGRFNEKTSKLNQKV